MGRKQLFEFEKYVTFNTEKTASKCILCQRILQGKLSGNIRRHYETIHKIKIIDEKNENNLHNAATNSRVLKNRTNNIKISLNKNEFFMCCVGLVTVKNIPFKIFDDEDYFKKLLRPYENFYKININSKNIVCKMNAVANEIKLIISNSVFKKMINLKIDVATKIEKNILGIYVQYIKDSKINISTIGMIQLKRRHTAQFLKEVIMDCLREFNIDISQIYSCTLDNVANVIESNKLLQELQEELLIQDPEPIIDDKDFDKIYSSLSSVLGVMRCAAHTIQLAAYDVLKIIQSQIDDCRKIVKGIHTVVRNDSSPNWQMPVVDNTTRWSSTYNMLKSLENVKEYIEDTTTSEPVWNFINKFLRAFEPLSKCTNKFQHQQYIIGDFYRDWLCCEVEIEDMVDDNIYAESLLNAMKRRKQKLLVNEAFLSAIYLDPRFNFSSTPFLSEDQKKIAVNHLLKTEEIIKRLTGENEDIKDECIIKTELPSYSGSFAKLEARMSLLVEQTSPTDRTTKQKLQNLCNAERVPFDTDILEYWKDTKILDPELGKLLDVALSVPSTQVTVEKVFSAHSIILTNLKTELSKDSIKNLILVKLNKNLIEHITFTDEEASDE